MSIDKPCHYVTTHLIANIAVVNPGYLGEQLEQVEQVGAIPMVVPVVPDVPDVPGDEHIFVYVTNDLDT